MFFQLNLLPEGRKEGRKDGRTKCLAIDIQFHFHPLPWYCDQQTKSVFHPDKKIKMNNLVVSISLCSEGLSLCYLKE